MLKKENDVLQRKQPHGRLRLLTKVPVWLFNSGSSQVLHLKTAFSFVPVHAAPFVWIYPARFRS